jgi:hypothetical protein
MNGIGVKGGRNASAIGAKNGGGSEAQNGAEEGGARAGRHSHAVL